MIGFKQVCVAVLGLTALAGAAHAATVFGDFTSGSLGGFGTLTNSSGVTAGTFSSPTTADISAASAGLTTNALHFTGSGYNGGLSGGSTIGYDFAASGQTAAFQANDKIEFDWIVAPSAAASGYSQLYQFVLNGPGAGYQGFGGTSGSNGSLVLSSAATGNAKDGAFNSYAPYTGQVFHVTIDYAAFKTALTGTGYIQFGIVTNNGGGAPSDFYFDNFTLTPEPASLSVLALGAGALLRRRR